MIGAIAGDIIGSIYERYNIKSTHFPLFKPTSKFTDDTVMTIAVADVLLNGKDYTLTLQEYGKRYLKAGYGRSFRKWISDANPQPYNSWGNGSAMRVSPIAYAFSTMDEVLAEAERSAEITHNHPEGIKGAKATAAAVFMARKGKSKQQIKDFIQTHFKYDLERKLKAIRPIYKFDVSCQGSVPESIIAFLESKNVEDAIRLGISIGGDSDTIASIAGAIAYAYYKEISTEILEGVRSRLDDELWDVFTAFNAKFPV